MKSTVPGENSATAAFDPFAGPEIERVVPSTESQRELWLATELSPDGSLAYSEAATLHFKGSMHRAAMRSALELIIARHDALRCTFSSDGEQLLVGTPGDVCANALGDWSRLDDASLRQAERRAVTTRWDMSRGPLFRVELLSDEDSETHAVVLSAHHAVCDGWSWTVLVKDLADCYAEAVSASDDRGIKTRFPEQFSAHAGQPELATSPESLEYWLKCFSALPPALELPLDHQRPATRNPASLRADLDLPQDLVDAVRQQAVTQGCSLFSWMLSAFSLLVARITGQDDLVIGIPSAGQPAIGCPGMVGHCVNTLPLRFLIQPGEAFHDFASRGNETLLDAVDHQDCTLSALLQHLPITREPSRVPLVSVLFNLDSSLDDQVDAFPGLRMAYTTIPRVADNFELSINIVGTPTGMRLECQYATALFSASTAARWMRAYAMLLKGLSQDASRSVNSYKLLDADALAELKSLQPPVTPFHADRLMHQHFEEARAITPDAIAVSDAHRSMSYAELDAEANRIAHLLQKKGVLPGTLVAIAVERDACMLSALLGILKAGAGYIPLDPGFPAARLAYMLEDGCPSAVLTTRALAATLPLQQLPVVLLDAGEEGQTDSTPVVLGTPPSVDDVAYVIYTSGSTGKPKGVEISHRAVGNFLESMRQTPGISASDVLVSVTTLSFDIAVLELFLPLCAGARVVIVDRDTAMDGDRLAEVLAAEEATLMQATPATWRMLLLAGWQGASGFRMLCGGEALPQVLAAQLLGCGSELWNMYGPTETTIWSTCERVLPGRAGLPDINIGRPIANTQVWILDQDLQLCIRGVPGELCIAGEGLARGYHERPELTADRFVTWDDAGAPIRLYRTGDRARWREDGCLEHQGRMDDQVKVRGYRIELGEIESRLATHPSVQSAVVVVREDTPDDVRLVAYAIPSDTSEVDANLLREHLRRDLPDYMIPQHIVGMDVWPLTANGKIDRRQLPAPDHGSAPNVTHAAPETPSEVALLPLFERILGIAGIGIDDDFFLSGGHSLLAAQLTTQINKQFGCRLSLRSIFDAPTVRRLAVTIDGATKQASTGGANDSDAIPRSADQSWAPLSDAQQRHALLQEFNPDSVVYNSPSAHRLIGPFDLDRFRNALANVMRRQTVMRTGIGLRDGQRVQLLQDVQPQGVDVIVDLSHLSREASEAVVARDIRRLVARPFTSLASAPLFSSRLYRVGQEETIWFFMPHHVIWDGWSFDILYSELGESYAALEEGRDPQLPELRVSFGDFARWHNEWLNGSEYAAQLAHWKRSLCEPDAEGNWPQPLPTDRPRQRLMSGTARHLSVNFGDLQPETLHAAARQQESTVFMMVLTAYCAALSHRAKQKAILIGTPVRGRNHVDTEPLMGDFVNLLPVRANVDPAMTLTELLRHVRSSFLDALSMPDLRLEDWGQLVATQPESSGRVLYHALFSWQDIRQRRTQWGSLAHSRVHAAQQGTSEDLGLWIVEETGKLSGGLAYNEALFERGTILQLYARYLHALARLVQSPGMTVAALHAELDGVEFDGHGIENLETEEEQEKDRMPNDKREQYVIDLWKRHLNVEVAPDDNFFDLGGTSMLAMKMGDELARETGFKLRLPELAVQSAAQLAAQLPAATDGGKEGGWLKRMFKR